MDKLKENLQKHRTVMYLILYSYLVFNGCFAFPFSNELFPLDYDKGCMLILGYGQISIVFAVLFNRNKHLNVLLATFFLTLLGMLCRYFLEYGEFSNTINFTPLNIASFLIIIPVFCTIVYWITCKHFS